MSKYKRNFLTDVTFRVDFPIILGLDSKNPPAQFQSEVNDRYPILEPKPIKSFELKFGKEPKTISEMEFYIWQFFNKEKKRMIEITSDHIALEYHVYNNFNEFYDDVEYVFRKFFNIYNIVKLSKRIGLRYINQIKLSGSTFDWNNIINPNLVFESRDFLDDKNNIKKSMHLFELKNQICDLKFQFGMFNSEFPNPIARKEFVLDYDCFLREDIDISEVYSKAKAFYEVIKLWFEKSIEDGLRAILNNEE